MKTAHLEFVSNLSTVILWRVEDHVRHGMGFEAAKELAIKESSRHWKYLSPRAKADALRVARSIKPSDMHANMRRLYFDRHLADIERVRGRPAGRIERLFFRVTGLCW